MDFDQLSRSRSHLALAQAWGIETKPCDRRAALAHVVSMYSGDPILPVLLLAAEALESNALRAGGDKCRTICRTDIMRVLDVDLAKSELVLRIAGFKPHDGIWCYGDRRFDSIEIEFEEADVKAEFEYWMK